MITPAFVHATYFHYSSFEELTNDFLSVLNSIFLAFPDLRAGRMGLRYINNIDPPGADAFGWSEYIDEHLLCLFSRFNDRKHVTRLFNIVEFKDDDMQIKFQFGVPNPDYPATIRRSLFVLDIDGFVQGLQDFSEIAENIDRAHVWIQRLFEESISERLRELMNGR